jgi:hypothetical protein
MELNNVSVISWQSVSLVDETVVQMADIFQISLINYTDEVGNDY